MERSKSIVLEDISSATLHIEASSYMNVPNKMQATLENVATEVVERNFLSL